MHDRQSRFVRRFKRRILARYFVRFHMGLILAGTGASGLLSSKVLLELGVQQMLLRYPLAVVSSYLFFLLLVRIWVWYVQSAEDKVDAALEHVSDEVDVLEFTPDMTPDFSQSSPGDPESSSFDLDLGESWMIVLLLAVLLIVIFGAGAYLVYAAPDILAEAAFEGLLASSLARVSRSMAAAGWTAGVLKSTWIPLVLVLGMTMVLAYGMHKSCPSATKVVEAVRCRER